MTLSYEAILKRVHTDKWLAFVKFVGDKVDKQVSVRDIRSDHHACTCSAYSLSRYLLFLCTDTASYQPRKISLSSRETLRC